MSKAEWDEIKEMWAREVDDYLLKAATEDLNNYPEEVQRVIIEEAHKRGLVDSNGRLVEKSLGTCKNHPGIQALDRCTDCMGAFCSDCLTVIGDDKYCDSCNSVIFREEVTLPCKEASDAFKIAIIGLFIIAIILEPIAILKALKAKKMINANPRLTGSGKATAALIIGIIRLLLEIFLILVVSIHNYNNYRLSAHRTQGMHNVTLVPARVHLADKVISIGNPFPELEFNDIDGNLVNIGNLKGKVVLIDFWATWCGPCKAETPRLLSVYKDYHDKGLEIIGISLDKDRQKLNAYLEKHEIKWPNYYDGKGWKNEISTRFGINSIPNMLLVDSQGILKETGLRGDRIREAVSQLIQGNIVQPAPDKQEQNDRKDKTGFDFKQQRFDPPSTLTISVRSIDSDTGQVIVNGCDTQRPTTPFTWDWGDEQVTSGFFPQQHTYSDLTKNYIIMVTSHYSGGGMNTAQTLASFTTP